MTELCKGCSLTEALIPPSIKPNYSTISFWDLPVEYMFWFWVQIQGRLEILGDLNPRPKNFFGFNIYSTQNEKFKKNL
jgi:hypothetical protein